MAEEKKAEVKKVEEKTGLARKTAETGEEPKKTAEETREAEPKNEGPQGAAGEAKKDRKEAAGKEGEKKEKKKKEKKGKKVDIVSERVYMIPLSKVHRTKPHYRRANKAVRALQAYLERHIKSKNITVGNALNHYIWSRGASKPPRRLQVRVVEDSEGKFVADLLK